MASKRRTTRTLTASRPGPDSTLDQAAASHEPILITGKRANAVLISEEDWRAVQETLCLLSIPGMRASIRKSLKTPVEACSPELRW